MTNYDLIVLIPWAIVGIVFVLICIRLQASSAKSQSHAAQSAGRARASREEPDPGQDSDAEIRDAVTEKVIVGDFALDPNAFDVTVRSGIVTITGQVACHAVAIRLIDTLRHAEGVAGVRDRLAFPRAGQADGAVLPRRRPSR